MQRTGAGTEAVPARRSPARTCTAPIKTSGARHRQDWARDGTLHAAFVLRGRGGSGVGQGILVWDARPRCWQSMGKWKGVLVPEHRHCDAPAPFPRSRYNNGRFYLLVDGPNTVVSTQFRLFTSEMLGVCARSMPGPVVPHLQPTAVMVMLVPSCGPVPPQVHPACHCPSSPKPPRSPGR